MIENIKKFALLLIVALLGVACDKKDEKLLYGTPPIYKLGLIREMEVPIGLKSIGVRDVNGKKLLNVCFDIENYKEDSETFKRICDSYFIDCNVPYMVSQPYDWCLKVIGGEIKDIVLKCKQDFNSQFGAGCSLNTLLKVRYAEIKKYLYDYKNCDWIKSRYERGAGWYFPDPDNVVMPGDEKLSLFMPIWDKLDNLTMEIIAPSSPGTYDFILTMTVYTPIYGEKKMEKEFSITWE